MLSTSGIASILSIRSVTVSSASNGVADGTVPGDGGIRFGDDVVSSSSTVTVITGNSASGPTVHGSGNTGVKQKYPPCIFIIIFVTLPLYTGNSGVFRRGRFLLFIRLR